MPTEPSGHPPGMPATMPQMKPQPLAGDEMLFGGLDLFDHSPTAEFGLQHHELFSAIWNQASKSYSWRWDEAYSRCRTDALAMARDCWMMAMFNERRFPTSQLSWHLEPENKKDPFQAQTTEFLTAVLQATPNFEELLFQLLWAIWYGRAGVEICWNWEMIRGQKALTVQQYFPVNGDKIQFTWDGMPELMIYSPEAKGLEARQPGTEVRYTDRWAVLVLNQPYWRDRFIIHNHDAVDADFFEGLAAGSRFGVGIRSWCYWKWWMISELLSWATDFMERIGLGWTVYYYEAGNKQAQAQAIQIAKQQGRNTWCVWPRNPGEAGATTGVERIEPSTSGADFIVKLLEYLEKKVERFIVGQSMSSGADKESGLGGSGRAKFAMDTKSQIIKADANRLAATVTRDLVRVAQRYNCPQAKFPINFRFDIDTPDPKEHLEAAKIFWDMGGGVEEDELRGVVGLKKPEGDAKVLENPQMKQAEQEQDTSQAEAQAKMAALQQQQQIKTEGMKQQAEIKGDLAKEQAEQKSQLAARQHEQKLSQAETLAQRQLQSKLAAHGQAQELRQLTHQQRLEQQRAKIASQAPDLFNGAPETPVAMAAAAAEEDPHYLFDADDALPDPVPDKQKDDIVRNEADLRSGLRAKAQRWVNGS